MSKFKVWDKVEVTHDFPDFSKAIEWVQYYITEVMLDWYYLWEEKWVFKLWMHVSEKYIIPYEEYKEWEEVEVNDGDWVWNKRIFITKLPWRARSKYITVIKWDEERFLSWKDFGVMQWRYIRKLQEKEEERKIVCNKAKREEIQKILKLNK